MHIPRLLYPKILQNKNRLTAGKNRSRAKALIIGFLGLFFWAVIFLVFYRVLGYFKSIDVLGVFLASKLLSMILLTFFSILIFSNIITSLSTYFMSDELQLIISSPYDMYELYFTKFIETIMNSSWMVLLFSLPVFFSYGVVFDQSVWFYIVLIIAVIPFLIISTAMGTALTLGLLTVFPAKRLKDILFLLSIFLVIGLYLLFRLIRPERFVDPDAFFTVLDYLASLETPSSPFLPSQWATDALNALLFQGNAAESLFPLLLLWSTALAFMVLLNWAFDRLYYNAWSKSQEAKTIRITRNRFFNFVLKKILQPVPMQLRAVIDKDMRTFFRDTAQWSQLFILSAIIIIYLYNFSVLPMEKSPIPTIQLQNLIAFLNLGLAGFVISAVAVRFAYPAVSLEGESYWIMKSAPLSLKELVWCKFWVNFVLLFVLAEILIIFTNYLLRVDMTMMCISTVTVFFMTAGLTSLSIGFGATYPRFRYENIAQIPTGFGGLMYMIMSILFIGLIVVLEAWPVHILLMSRLARKSIEWIQVVEIAASFAAVVVISVVVFIVPMRVGIKKLTEREEY